MPILNIITLELQIENDPALFILLHRDGTINRKGNGSEIIDNNFFMGLTATSKMLDELGGLVNEEFMQFMDKVFDAPGKEGKKCSIEIALEYSNQEMHGTKFYYGTKSIGPPKPVSDFVIRAIELTNPWYYEQQKMVKKKSSRWWKFWE